MLNIKKYNQLLICHMTSRVEMNQTWLKSPVANLASARENAASFMTSPMVCLESTIFLRIILNLSCKASAFFFKRLWPFWAPFSRAFMLVMAPRLGKMAIRSLPDIVRFFLEFKKFNFFDKNRCFCSYRRRSSLLINSSQLGRGWGVKSCDPPKKFHRLLWKCYLWRSMAFSTTLFQRLLWDKQKIWKTNENYSKFVENFFEKRKILIQNAFLCSARM